MLVSVYSEKQFIYPPNASTITGDWEGLEVQNGTYSENQVGLLYIGDGNGWRKEKGYGDRRGGPRYEQNQVEWRWKNGWNTTVGFQGTAIVPLSKLPNL